MNQQLYIFLWK